MDKGSILPQWFRLPQVAQLQLAHAPLRGTEELRGRIAGLIGLHRVGVLEGNRTIIQK